MQNRGKLTDTEYIYRYIYSYVYIYIEYIQVTSGYQVKEGMEKG